MVDYRISKKSNLSCYKLNVSDLKKIYDILEKRTKKALQLEIDSGDGITEQQTKDLTDAYNVTVNVTGIDGESFAFIKKDQFDSGLFPENVLSIYFSTGTAYTSMFPNCIARNYVLLFLDFSKVPIPSQLSSPSNSTQNNSNIDVSGNDEDWIAGTYKSLITYLENKKTGRSWLYKDGLYEAFIWIIGIPLIFALQHIYILPLLSTFLIDNSMALEAAIILYSFVIMGLFFRSLFIYVKWAFPKMEFLHKRSRAVAHRAVSAIILLGIISSGIVAVI